MKDKRQDGLGEIASCGGLEQVLNGNVSSNEGDHLIPNDVLLRNAALTPKSLVSCGAYNRTSYLCLCYNFCLFENGRRGKELKHLLCFKAGSTKCRSILASLAIVLFVLLPFAAGWPFIINTSTSSSHYIALLIFTCGFEFLLFVWHTYCIYVTKLRNYEEWEDSWFTFCVEKNILNSLQESEGNFEDSFSIEEKLKLLEVSVTDLCRMNSVLHQISVDEREKLALTMEENRLEQAGVILYSEEFIRSFVTYSLYELFLLAVLSVASFGLMLWKVLIII